MKRILYGVFAAAVLFGAASCNPETYKNINYLQDVKENTSARMKENTGIIIQPQDQLSIVVTSRDPRLATQFNLPVSTFYTGSEIGSAGGSQRITGYIVDNAGDIEFPSLGTVHVAGLNRWELQELIRDKLAASGMLKDAVVIVEFMNFKISVLGEVTTPGTYAITGDKITILQALALAHDLTIYGERENVMVIREQNGKRQTFVIDLTRQDLFNSPAYYLQQNDVVYVTPNTVRAGQSTINENYFKSGSFWISLGSIAITVANLIITMSRR